jgi:3-oxoacyl-[acyl-carrier protein] reductase
MTTRERATAPGPTAPGPTAPGPTAYGTAAPGIAAAGTSGGPTLAGQVAVVTGGGGGLGIAIGRALGRAGASVVLADIAEPLAASAAATLVEEGITARPAVADVTDRSSVDTVVARLLDQHGRIDILVNNAGFTIDRPLVEMDDDAWRRVLDVCLYGTFACCRAVAPAMIDRRYGRIVNIASRAYLGNPGQANYSAAKAGIVGLTKALAKELGRHEITVNAVAPGLVETEAVRRHPKFAAIAERARRENSIRRLGTPADVAAAVANLASPEASFVTGDVVHVSGGRFS